MKRVYYSAFSPIPDASSQLRLRPAPLMREHRLYQADWLLRFYSLQLEDIATGADGLLPLDIDSKFAWALEHRVGFPLDVNSQAGKNFWACQVWGPRPSNAS